MSSLTIERPRARRTMTGLTMGFGALAGAGVCAHALPAACAVVPALRPRFGVRDRLDDPGGVALTFDDGPDPHGTRATLAVLADAAVHATFFLTGEQVRDRPRIAAEIVADGHAIALHGDRHRNLLRVGPHALRADMLRGAAAIEAATGQAPMHYRPPYGVLSGAALAVARQHGWEPVLWTRWGRDWRRRATAATVASEVADGLRGGEILLLHDSDRYASPHSWCATVAALPGILERVRAAGLQVVRLPSEPR